MSRAREAEESKICDASAPVAKSGYSASGSVLRLRLTSFSWPAR